MINARRRQNPLHWHWYASYKTNDGYSHYSMLKATTQEQAVKEAEHLPNLKKIYEVYRRSEEHSGNRNPDNRKDMESTLYENFHNAKPKGIRKVFYEPPPKGQPLVKLGILTRLDYRPEAPSKKANVEFYHYSGDTGATERKSNLILCTDKQGRNIYLVKDKDSKFPYVNERGVIG